MWTIGKSTLTNKAGLWKSEDTWNLVTLQPEIFQTSAPKGEFDIISYTSDPLAPSGGGRPATPRHTQGARGSLSYTSNKQGFSQSSKS